MSCENCCKQNQKSKASVECLTIDICDGCGESGCQFCIEDGLCDKCKKIEEQPYFLAFT